jgi:phosphate transport system substrate-binding protein
MKHFRIGGLLCAASFALFLTTPAVNAGEQVVVGGSGNPAAAVEAAAKAFMGQDSAIDVTVHTSSSGAGIAALKAKAVDVAMSDVAVSEPNFVDHRIGWLGIAIIAGPNTGVTGVTRAQMMGIYSGKITNWKQIGGNDQSIVPMSRPIGTGTRFLFEELVAKTPIETQAPVKASDLVALADKTPGAIAYVATNFVKPGDTVLSYEGVLPTPENVRSHRYTFAADEHLYTLANSNQSGDTFANFVIHNPQILAKFGIF